MRWLLVATFTLTLLQTVMMGALLHSARYVTPYAHPEILSIVLYMIEYPIMIILGAWIVRDSRQTKSRAHSHA
ncbi:MAG: hypothetical protein WBL50_01480 [Candidatus Acidiferrum sp.]